uniref:Phosphatidylinositol4phosphate5kinase (PiPIPKD5) putative n=1 Tax=Albugo laibachii Nc14 TaxID=890382 RepID=F0W208_9STRA|nr:phosphatidylinositol4phosphate5kinase (PiPIPKD5) putative [Albugo laibachii Nc14]|eukprot:CCA15087.1 phosphatidylinositol4phosphate5kinase (PiPIPKD5) putative [Albugo laibachii Nc14]
MNPPYNPHTGNKRKYTDTPSTTDMHTSYVPMQAPHNNNDPVHSNHPPVSEYSAERPGRSYVLLEGNSNREFDLGLHNSHIHPQRMSNPVQAPSNVIRVINKDMTDQFRGRAPSISQARIRWFENRKSQLLGCCMTMAFLGVTIAMYSYRWTGLIAGSVNTIICGSAVIITYFRKKHWHQHPNPIVHNRAVLGVFLAICLLLNVWINFDVSSDSNESCRQLAGVTEFFFFTSEAWGLVMACDLYFSLNSPFTSYKRMMRFYHLWVWVGGIIMGGITWGVNGAGGFFTVDGQSLEYGKSLSTIVGFCMASSRICCPRQGQCDAYDYPKCYDDSNFLTTQEWPWILIYTFVILVLVVSVCVLTLAWHRLYLRGVPKTYNMRLRVLNYISFFTGACVFYWLLLLLLYMCAYFLATKSNQSANTQAVAQVLRQLVAFLIASKGYLDFVIWFAVNNIERPTGGRKEDSRDFDVDLSPQVNMALRSEILYYTTSGVKSSIQAVQDEEISIPISGESDRKKSVKFWSYCPVAFRKIRYCYGITDQEYTRMFGATTKEQFSEGRSGAFMFFTGDEQLIVKTMSSEECNFLRKIASQYAQYMTTNTSTLLTRFYGCHGVSLYGNVYFFVVMGNLFSNTQIIHHRYDIKGSWVDRNAKIPKPGDKTTCRYCNASYTYGSLKNQECGDNMHFHEPNIVLKDNDLMMKIRIDSNQATRIYDQLHRDSDFLCEQGIMDYSLLMGVRSCEYFVDAAAVEEFGDKEPDADSIFTQPATSVSGPSLYHFGIIDILQQWTFQKKVERFYKCHIKRKDSDGIKSLGKHQSTDLIDKVAGRL